ncbi:MAG: lysophospholipid acyltransferase family protein [Gemmatimonadaceae bacterium]
MKTRDRISRAVPAELRSTLTPLERLHLDVALRMNREPFKGFWTQCQRFIGALAVRFLTRNVVRDHGFAHVADAFRRGAILFVANHRTYFDMFIVSSLVHRRLPGRKRLFFPVIGQYYYQSLGGMALNQLFAFWSMFPPLFALPSHADVDRYALDLLCDLCARGPGYVLGIHPEGGRNLDPDPYSFMRFQPGAGRIIHAARPIVIPVFLAGMHTNVGVQVRRNWSGGEPVRVWFGAPVDLDAHYALPAKGSTYKRIVDDVMERVRALGEEDRSHYGR